MEFVLNATQELKSIITESSAVIARKDIEKHQVKDVMENASLFAQ